MAWHDGVKTGIAWPVLAGIITLVIGFGGFGTWAAMAPLEGAVVAPGKVATSGQNKTVQHLEGGIVREILVEEGQRVAAGEPVLVLDGTASEANLNRLKAQLTTFDAIEARALAERNGADEITFPEGLLDEKATPEVAKVVEDQKAEFKARLEKHQAELGIFKQQIAALQEAITGHEAQKKEVMNEIALVQEERETLEELLRKGLTTKTRVMELRRAEADLRGREGQLTAAIAEAKQSIAEVQEQIERTKGARLEEASARLSEVRLRRSQILEEIRSAQDISDRVAVRAPVSGTVINLTKYNPGAVITPGQVIMEIVPEDTELLVEAHVRPQDIDEVRIGQEARLNFAALDQRETPPVPGEVIHVSADRLENERTGEIYYLVRLRISSEPLTGFDRAKIGPGQPVDVFITTGERTFAAYLMEPIVTTLRRSLRES
jgi:HlyD family secretion protein